MPLRPCWVCRQPVPDGRCPTHPRTAYQYRPDRPRYGTHVTGELRTAVMERDDWTCRYCGVLALTVDHMVPRSRGGATEVGNLVACCASCNRSKKDRTLREWVASGCAPRGALALLEALT